MNKEPVYKDWLTEEELVERLESLRNGRSLRSFVTDFPGVFHQGLYLMLKERRIRGAIVPRFMGYEAVTVFRPIAAAPQSKKKAGKRR